jgi:uncharacterized membrane protein (UPF0127 family)
MPERGPLRLVHPPSGRVLAGRLLVPRSFVGRGLGLMFKRALDPGVGMWIVPCSGIHMFFMGFAIDAVFLDREQRVVRVCPNLKPWRVVPIVFGAHSVLELPANTLSGLGIKKGDPLSIEPA